MLVGWTIGVDMASNSSGPAGVSITRQRGVMLTPLPEATSEPDSQSTPERGYRVI